MPPFDIFKEEKARLNLYKELIEGCKRHPAYRCKRKPSAPCKRCEDLFSFYSQLKAWDEGLNQWWRTWFAEERLRQIEDSRAREERMNCPG